MSDTQDKKLEAMLQSRVVEPPGTDLAERIIFKAQELPQTQPITLTEWIKRLFGEFHLPQPAYVLACTLMLGLVVGFTAPVETPTPERADAAYVQGFFDADEPIL
jgi:hypothetical protein